MMSMKEESYHELLAFSNELDDTFKLEGNRLFYLAMAPLILLDQFLII